MIYCPYTETTWRTRDESGFVHIVAGNIGLPVLTPNEARALARELRITAQDADMARIYISHSAGNPPDSMNDATPGHNWFVVSPSGKSTVEQQVAELRKLGRTVTELYIEPHQPNRRWPVIDRPPPW